MAICGHPGSRRITSGDIEGLPALPATIDSSLRQIDWRVERRVEGRDPRPFVNGKTKNQLYVTAAAADRMHETVLHLACEGAKGKCPRNPGEAEADALARDREVVDGVWSMFSGRETKRVDGKVMKYTHFGEFAIYHDSDNPEDDWHDYDPATPKPEPAKGMLTSGIGQCTAWDKLLRDCLIVHGVTARMQAMTGPLGSDGFRVKTTPVQGSLPGTSYGQVDFDYHVVTVVDVYPDRIYDPSYGGEPSIPDLSLEYGKLAWENDHLEGPFYYIRNSAGVIIDWVVVNNTYWGEELWWR